MRHYFVPVAALVCCVSSGCVSDSARAREAAQTFMTAANRGDSAAMLPVTTRAARPYVAKITPESLPSKASVTLGDPTIKDKSAEVPMVTLGEDSKSYAGTVFLRYEENQWRVWGMRTQLTNGGELMLDLEHPERMAGALLGAAFGELAKGLEGLSKDAEKSGRQLGEALGGFMKGFVEGMEKSAPKTNTEPTPEPERADPLTPPLVK